MAVIDFVQIGSPIPDYIPDFVPKLTEPHFEEFLSVDIKTYERLGFSYVPYVPWNVNRINMYEAEPSEVISSRFSGCLMTAWQDSEGLFVGHVHAGDPHDCKKKWAEKRDAAMRSFEFQPFKAVPTQTDGRQPLNCYGFIEFDDTTDIIAAFSVFADINNIVTVKKLMFKGHFTGKIII